MKKDQPTERFQQIPQRPPRRILIIKLRAIGDVLLSTIVTKNLRAAFPDAEIDFITEYPSREIIEDNPYISNPVIFHPKQDNPLAFFWKLYRRKYDLVFDLFCNPRSAQMTFATRAPIRVGYPFRGRAYAYNIHVSSRSDVIHNTGFNLDPLAALQIPIVDRNVHFYPPDNSVRWAKEFVSGIPPEKSLLIALNPSGTWHTKRWGLKHFAALADALVELYGATCVLIWGPGEEQDVRTIQSMMTAEAVIPPPTSLKQLGALLSQCDCMISNDSGPMHIGAAMGIPVLGIFGPTNPHLQGPYNPNSMWIRNEKIDCLACNLTSCPIGNVCMTDLEVETVLEAFAQLLTRS